MTDLARHFPATFNDVPFWAVCFSAVLGARIIGERVKDRLKWAPHFPKSECQRRYADGLRRGRAAGDPREENGRKESEKRKTAEGTKG